MLWIGLIFWSFRSLAASGGVSGSDWTSPTVGVMKYIPAGTFTMGSPTSEIGRYEDEPQHKVTLTKGFLMMEHEVTQGEWLSVMGSNPSSFNNCGSSCPVEKVSWDEVQIFIQNVSKRDGVMYRLPTEAEWEYAARGGQSHRYAGSDDLGTVGWHDSNSEGQTRPVCQKKRNGYGLCDMSGNIWEWVEDRYAPYPGDTVDYLNINLGSGQIYRGGAWGTSATNARVASRFSSNPSFKANNIGFRLSRTVP